MDPKEALHRVVAGEDLSEDEARAVMGALLEGQVEEAWTAGFLVALRLKGETVSEIAGFARSMREHATPIKPRCKPLVDTCGTGGDSSGSFNISTAAAFVVAGAGAHVAKHGNRSVSSRCGSADVLEALGARLDLTPEAVTRCVEDVGFGFLFAPQFHGAMRHAVGPRKALGMRTVFNLLGPLTNPAAADHQVLGVFDGALLDSMGEVLRRLGAKRSLLVHGHDGLDELTVTGPSSIVVVDAEMTRMELRPEDVGLARHDAASLSGGNAEMNARIVREVFDGSVGGARDIVLLNAGAALFAVGLGDDLRAGVERAAAAVDDGHARDRLDAFVEFTQSHGGPG